MVKAYNTSRYKHMCIPTGPIKSMDDVKQYEYESF